MTRRAASLIELVLVVVIIAVIAVIALPRTTHASRNAQAAAMAAHIRRLVAAFDLYHAEHGAWPADTTPGRLPTEMAGRLNPSDFRSSPAGGKYDWNYWPNGQFELAGSAISIFETENWDIISSIDEILDDGDLQTGAFVRHSLHHVRPDGLWVSYWLTSD